MVSREFKAMGGTLEVRAAFPEGAVVKINQFEDLDGKAAKRVRRLRGAKR